MEKITLDEAIRRSYQSRKNTFVWQTTENILGCVFYEEYTFKNVSVLWGHNTYAFSCLLTFAAPDGTTFTVGVNSNNGYFQTLENMRQSLPSLFEVNGGFKPLQLLWNV